MLDCNGRFVWFELMVPDAERAITFYSNVLGWSTKDASSSGRRYTLFSAAGEVVAGLAVLPPAARTADARARWMGYVAVDEVDATAERVPGLGGVVLVPPRDMGAISRIAILSDQQSAMLAIIKWSRPDRHSTPVLYGPGGDAAAAEVSGRVGWHELLAVDWERAWPFYRDLFGWQKAETETGPLGTYQQFAVGGQSIGGMLTKPESVPFPVWLHYFTVPDIDASASVVATSGGGIIDGPTRGRDDRWTARCIDPQGGVFGLIGRRSIANAGKARFPTIQVYRFDRRDG